MDKDGSKAYFHSHSVVWMPVSTPEEAFDAIKTMRIRGAPAIASLAALTLRSYLNSSSCPVSSSSSSSDVISWIGETIDYLQSSRPTAVNLGEAMDRIRAALKDSEAQNQAAGDVIERVKKICGDVHDEDLERNMEMGRLGAEWLWKKRGGGKKGLKVVTVCNTGSLATSVSPSLSFGLEKLILYRVTVPLLASLPLSSKKTTLTLLITRKLHLTTRALD